MARVPQVTRTIQTTNANVLCLNIEEGEPFNTEVTIPRTYKNDKDMMKAIEPIINTDTVKAVHIVRSEIVETLYGMTEQDFINNATILPPRATDKDEETTDTNNNMEG